MEEHYKIQFNVVGLCAILKTDFWDVLADVYLGSPSRIREPYSFHFVHPSVYPSTIIILELWTRNHGSRTAEANLVTLAGLLTSIGSCAYRLDFLSKSKQFPEKQGKFSIEDIAICISKFLYLQARPSGWSWFRYCVIRCLIWNQAVWEDDHVVKTFCRDDNKRWIFIKYCVDYYYTYFVTVLLKMLL